jgi:ABC-type nitrate/sulfonate/bicarbonate transport system substrate-binding protein
VSAARAAAGRGAKPAGRLALLTTACMATAALTGCGTKEELVSSPQGKPFAVLLDSAPGGVHAPLYAALSHGDFRAAGLEVRLVTAPKGEQPLALLSAGSVQMALTSAQQLLLARDRGLAIVSIGALGERPARGGMPAYDEPVLAVRTREAERDGEDMRAFMHALARGADEARAQPRATAALIVAAGGGRGAAAQASGAGAHARRPRGGAAARAGSGGGRRSGAGQQAREAAAALSAVERELGEARPTGGPGASNPERPYGYQDAAAWAQLGDRMYSGHLLRTDPATLSPPFTNEYLPGEGI